MGGEGVGNTFARISEWIDRGKFCSGFGYKNGSIFKVSGYREEFM